MARIGSFIVGSVVGAVAALLVAPKTGEETRAFVADKANEAWGNAQNVGGGAQSRGQQFYNDAVAKGQEAYTRATTAAQDAFSAAQGRVQEVTGNAGFGSAPAQNDELREKIEAARARIAAQVAKNAEAVKETAAQIEVEAAAAESAK